MKLKFKIQQYKKDAVKNVVRVFDEQHNLCLLKYKNINHIQIESNSHLSNDVVKKIRTRPTRRGDGYGYGKVLRLCQDSV